ncbi:MAG TPA: class I SAM-dependent methyltransferase [Verrucomicrobiae bacterium]|jgi:SAM-dependent methyltransferase|nr:class I SAM-dependent methyltransferase [Verrucomicrobiae bacterium]
MTTHDSVSETDMAKVESKVKPPFMDLVLQRLLRFVCIKPTPEYQGENKETQFPYRRTQALIFLERFGDRVSFKDKRVLDFGCGYGSMSVVVAEQGAKRVVGIDTDDERVNFAKYKLRTEFKHFSDRIEFAVPNEFKHETFDLVISEDCFEHYEDPVAIMKQISTMLGPNGKVIIGFSCLWKSPGGGHIGCMTKLPWAHLVFPERVIMRERKRYRPDENARCFSEIRGGLNKMTYDKFLNTMEESGYEIESLATNVSKSKLVPIANLIRKIPFCFEYFTKNLYAVVGRAR